MNDEINKIKISTLIILNTLSCRSSGISLTRHKEFVSLFMLKTVKTANKMKYKRMIGDPPLCFCSILHYQIFIKKDRK